MAMNRQNKLKIKTSLLYLLILLPLAIKQLCQLVDLELTSTTCVWISKSATLCSIQTGGCLLPKECIYLWDNFRGFTVLTKFEI